MSDDEKCARCEHSREDHEDRGAASFCYCGCDGFEVAPDVARFELRLSRTELALWKAQADAEGLSLAAYVRRRVKLSGEVTVGRLTQTMLGNAVESALRASTYSIDNRVARVERPWSCPRCGWQHESGCSVVQGFQGARRCNACGSWT